MTLKSRKSKLLPCDVFPSGNRRASERAASAESHLRWPRRGCRASQRWPAGGCPWALLTPQGTQLLRQRVHSVGSPGAPKALRGEGALSRAEGTRPSRLSTALGSALNGESPRVEAVARVGPRSSSARGAGHPPGLCGAAVAALKRERGAACSPRRLGQVAAPGRPHFPAGGGRAGGRWSSQRPPRRGRRGLLVTSRLQLAASPGAGRPRRALCEVSRAGRDQPDPRRPRNHPETLAGWDGEAAEPHEARVAWPRRGAARPPGFEDESRRKYWCSGWAAPADPAPGTTGGALGGGGPRWAARVPAEGSPPVPDLQPRHLSHTGRPPRDREPCDGKRGLGGLKWGDGI